MSLFKRKKNKPLEIKDRFFISCGKWFERFREDEVESCRIVEDISIIPDEYIQSWADWNSNKSYNKNFGLPNKRME